MTATATARGPKLSHAARMTAHVTSADRVAVEALAEAEGWRGHRLGNRLAQLGQISHDADLYGRFSRKAHRLDGVTALWLQHLGQSARTWSRGTADLARAGRIVPAGTVTNAGKRRTPCWATTAEPTNTPEANR